MRRKPAEHHLMNPEQPIRVAHLLPDRAIGGTELNTLRLIGGLQDRGIQSVVFFPDGRHELSEYLMAADVEAVPWRNIGLWGRQAPAFAIESAKLAWRLARHDVDIIHCSKLPAAIGAGPFAGKLMSLPVVSHVRTVQEDLRPRQHLCLRLIDCFIFVSKAVRCSFDHQVSTSRDRVIYDALDFRALDARTENLNAEAKLNELDLPEDCPTIAMVSRLAPEKDFRTLCQALNQVVTMIPNAQLILVGDSYEPDYKRHIESMFDNKDLSDNVVFTGYRDDALEIMSAVDVVVLSSHTEGFGMVVLEGMALAKPVVATAVGGVPELISDGDTGFLCRPGDSDEMAKLLICLINNEQLASEIGSKARENAERLFSMAQMIETVEEVYRDLVAVG